LSNCLRSPASLTPQWHPVSANDEDPLLFLKIDKQSNWSVGKVKELEESLRFWQTFDAKHSFHPLNVMADEEEGKGTVRSTG